MDTQFILNVAHIHPAIAFVVDEHGQSSAVFRTLFRPCQHQVDVRVAVGDEAFHAIQSPTVFFFIISSLEHHALKVRASVGFSKIHRHGGTLTYAWDILFSLLVRAEFIQRVDARLQRPDVLKSCICCGYHLRHHRKGDVGQVQSAITSWHRYAPQACLLGCFDVVKRFAGILHAPILKMRTFFVHVFRVGFDDVCRHVASDFENAFVVLDSIIVIYRSIIMVLFVLVVALLELNNSLHQRMI